MSLNWFLLLALAAGFFVEKPMFDVPPPAGGAHGAPTFLPGHDPRPASKTWVAVDSLTDEFNGTTIDNAKWQTQPVGNGWNWIGRPPGLFKASNVHVHDGAMNVTVSKLDAPVTINGQFFTHQGAIVRSVKAGQPGYYFECRMKANATVMSSTFWLMTKYDCEKKQELDIQECVGQLTSKTHAWAKDWDQIFHSNAIHRTTACNPKESRVQQAVATNTKNHERYFTYGAWWKSPDEIQFFLDGKYVYSLNPTITWDMPAYLQMAVETYDWNPISDDGGLVENGTREQRTTKYDWVRTWKLQ